MHTTTIAGTSFIHNSDLSGAVTIVRPDGQLMRISGTALRGFIEEQVRDTLIGRIEQADIWSILTGDKNER